MRLYLFDDFYTIPCRKFRRWYFVACQNYKERFPMLPKYIWKVSVIFCLGLRFERWKIRRKGREEKFTFCAFNSDPWLLVDVWTLKHTRILLNLFQKLSFLEKSAQKTLLCSVLLTHLSSSFLGKKEKEDILFSIIPRKWLCRNLVCAGAAY